MKLALSGGGIKGILILGALSYYHENGKLESVKKFSGTSIGSVISLLLIVGYTPKEIFDQVLSVDNFFSSDKAVNPFVLLASQGLVSMDPLVNKIREMIKKKLGKIPSMYELFSNTGKTFYATIGSLSKELAVYSSHKTYPSYSSIDIMRASCNLPFIFGKILLDGEDVVDGGLFDNIPIEAFFIDPEEVDDEDILCINISSKESKHNHNNVVERLVKMVSCAMKTNTKLRLEKYRNDKRVKILDIVTEEDISFITSQMTEKQKRQLFLQGYIFALENDPFSPPKKSSSSEKSVSEKVSEKEVKTEVTPEDVV